MALALTASVATPGLLQNAGKSVANAEAIAPTKPQSITIAHITASTLNIRTGAGSSYKVVSGSVPVTQAKKGDDYRVLSTTTNSSGTWYKIQIGSGKTGYICGYEKSTGKRYASTYTAEWVGWCSVGYSGNSGAKNGVYVRTSETSSTGSHRTVDAIPSYSIVDMYQIYNSTFCLGTNSVSAANQEASFMVVANSGVFGYVDYAGTYCSPWYAWSNSNINFKSALKTFAGKSYASNATPFVTVKNQGTATLRSYPTVVANSSNNNYIMKPNGKNTSNKFAKAANSTNFPGNTTTARKYKMTGVAYSRNPLSGETRLFYSITYKNSSGTYSNLWLSSNDCSIS